MIQRYLLFLLALCGATLTAQANTELHHYTANQFFEYMLGAQHPSNHTTHADGVFMPSDFPKLPPRDAALKLAHLNRNNENLERYDLAYREGLGKSPASPVSISLDDQASGCYSQTSSHYFLRYAPGDSYLIYGRDSTPGGAVFHDIVQSKTSYELLWFTLDDATAGHLANVIWYLNQIESVRRQGKPRNSFSRLMSTADGRGELLWRSDLGGKQLMHGTLWGNYTSTAERLGNNRFKSETALNIAHYLLYQIRSEHTPTLTHQLIALQTLEQSNSINQYASPAIIAIAAQIAGETNMQAVRPHLEALLESTESNDLTASLKIALLQLEVSSQPERLEQWAIDGTKGARWALQQLQKEHPSHYAAALEKRLLNENGRAASDLLKALDRFSPERAQRASIEVIQRNDDALFVLAYSILQDAAFPDEATYFERLLVIANSETTDWRVRNAAINCIVPRNNPMRYRDPRIDVVLTNLTASDFSADNLEYSKLIIARAQLARQPEVHFTRLLRDVSKSLTVSTQSIKADNPYYRIQLLRELSDISEDLGTDYKEECEAALRKELKKGDLKADQLLRIALENNMRSVLPILSNYANRLNNNHAIQTAQQMLALWTERDALTRAKLWITYGYLFIYPSNCDYEGAKFRNFHKSLQSTSQQLTQAERKRLTPFIEQIEDKWLQHRDQPELATRKTQLIRSIIDGEPLDNYIGKCQP